MDICGRIIEAAWQLLWDVGYFGATTKRIAARAEIGESKLLRLYKDKQDLMAWVLQEKYPKELQLSYQYLTDKKDIKTELKDLLGQSISVAKFYLIVSHFLAVECDVDVSNYTLSSYIDQLAECFHVIQVKTVTEATDVRALAQMTMYHLLQTTAINRSKQHWEEHFISDMSNVVFEMLQLDKSTVNVTHRFSHRRDIKSLKEFNIRAVLEYCMQNDNKVVISELVRHVSLSKTTVIRIVNQLLEDGLLSDVGIDTKSSEERGRPPSSYCLNMEYGYVISINISVKEILVVLLNLKNRPLEQCSVSITGAAGFEDVMLLLKEQINSMMEKSQLEWKQILGVCVALQGRVDEIRGVAVYAPVFPNWPANVSVLEHIRTFIPAIVPVHINNEGVYLMIGEHRYGRAQKVCSAIVVDISSKLASGILIEDKIAGGSYAVAREIAHMQLDSGSSIPCVCGSFGCFRALVNAERAVEIYKNNLKRYPKAEMGANLNQLRFDDIAQEFLRGDPLAVWVFDEIAHWFGLAFSQLSIIYEPEIIVIQGDYVKAGEAFLDITRRYMVEGKYPFLEGVAPKIVYSSLQNEAMVLGAGQYALDEFVKMYVSKNQSDGKK